MKKTSSPDTSPSHKAGAFVYSNREPGTFNITSTFLEKKVRQFSMLLDLSIILNSTLEPSEIRKRAMEAATRLMDCEVGSLLLLDRNNGELYFEVALGKNGERIKEVRLKTGEGIAGWVALHGQPLIVNDVAHDSRHSRQVDEKIGYSPKNILCVPVRIKGKIAGVLQAINKRKDGNFDQDDLELFQLFANHVAIAIENASLYEEIRATFLEVSEALAQSIEKRDPYTGGHTKRVLIFSVAVAQCMQLCKEEVEKLKIAAILHDIGKIAIRDKILRKKGKLTDEEYKEIKKHPVIGAEILQHVRQLHDVIPGMRYHHERTDGKGYPEGLRGSHIPLIARIIAVADAFDAMTTNRSYHIALTKSEAIAELKRCAGLQFDRDVVDAFLQAFENGDIYTNREARHLSHP